MHLISKSNSVTDFHLLFSISNVIRKEIDFFLFTVVVVISVFCSCIRDFVSVDLTEGRLEVKLK